MKKLIAGIFALGLVAGCASYEEPCCHGDGAVIVTQSPGHSHDYQPPAPPNNAHSCAKSGGVWERAGMLGQYRCTFYYPDGGKVCADASQCMGKCIASDDVTNYNAPAGHQVGRCAKTDSPFGCYAEVKNGTTGAALCVD